MFRVDTKAVQAFWPLQRLKLQAPSLCHLLIMLDTDVSYEVDIRKLWSSKCSGKSQHEPLAKTHLKSKQMYQCSTETFSTFLPAPSSATCFVCPWGHHHPLPGILWLSFNYCVLNLSPDPDQYWRGRVINRMSLGAGKITWEMTVVTGLLTG